MIEDPVVEEIRRIRQEHAAQFDYDLKAIFADLKRTEEARDQQQSPLLTPREPQDGENAEPNPGLHEAEPRLTRFGR
jgi:hypothetical protein